MSIEEAKLALVDQIIRMEDPNLIQRIMDMLQQWRDAELEAALDRSIQQAREGKTTPDADVMNETRKKLGIQ